MNGALSRRSPGSTLKPFIYACAIDQGMCTPASVVADTPMCFKGYDPKNYNLRFLGPVSVRDALVQSLNIPAGYIEPEKWDREAAIDRIKQRFGIDGELFESYAHPYLYFSQQVHRALGEDRAAIEAAVVDELAKFPGVSLAVSSTALRRGEVPDTPIYRSVLNNFHSKRSGDVYLVFEPNWFINDFDGLTVAATHGSPWRYDTYVPIVFAGAGLKHGVIDRKVLTVDIAPTLSAYLGIKPPSGSQGTPLTEVLEQAASPAGD